MPLHGEVRFGSKCEELNMSKSSPLYPTFRTSTRRVDTSLMGPICRHLKSLARDRNAPTSLRTKRPLPFLECRLDAPPADPRKRPIRSASGTVRDVLAPGIRPDRID